MEQLSQQNASDCKTSQNFAQKKKIEEKSINNTQTQNKDYENVEDNSQRQGASDLDEEEIPEHFYDSDLESVNERDYLSDNEPPQDMVQERKLLQKKKFLHIYKTIVRLGYGIDKPARYDKVSLRVKKVPTADVVPKKNALQLEKKKVSKANKNKEIGQNQKVDDSHQKETQIKEPIEKGQSNEKMTEGNVQVLQNEQQIQQQVQTVQKGIKQKTQQLKQQLPFYYSSEYLQGVEKCQYNIGKNHMQIEDLVISMRKNQTAVFQLEYLKMGQANIKVRRKVQVYVISLKEWTTVIDIKGDMSILKQVQQRGQGPFRVELYDDIAYLYAMRKGQTLLKEQDFQEPIKLEPSFVQKLHPALWATLQSMKHQEISSAYYYPLQQKSAQQNQQQKCQHSQNQETISFYIKIYKLHKVDNVFRDGRLLKKTLVKGVSTARPEGSSTLYYALKLYDEQKVIFQDDCFNSDWWEDYGKLQELGCRKCYLDNYRISKALKYSLDLVKPGETAEIQCRDPALFTYGEDYELFKEKSGRAVIPCKVIFHVRVYNFTQGRNCFNMDLDQKIQESRRQKQIALKLLQDNHINKAQKRFQSIIAFYAEGHINQEAYEEKISALMNAQLCLMKNKNYSQMLPLCEQVLQRPKHGHDVKNMKIKGAGNYKVQGTLGKEGDDLREEADIAQNPKIIDKCLYRKALALVETGECTEALKSLSKIQSMNTEVAELTKRAEEGEQKYKEKSKKIFKNMFG